MAMEDVFEPDECYEEEVVFDISELSEGELAQLLSESEQNDELFDIPDGSLEPLFLSFLQSAVKVVIKVSTFSRDDATLLESHDLSTLYVKLDYALGVIEKLVLQAGPDKLRDFSETVLLQSPRIVSVLLNFAVDVWQGKVWNNSESKIATW